MDRLQSRRQGVRLFVALIAIGVVVGGAGLAAGLSLRSGGTATTTNPASAGAPTDAPSGEPTRTPEPRPSGSTPAASSELPELEAALKQAGYACFESVREPVLVHSCYLEPGTRSLDEQAVRIQISPDGTLVAVDAKLSYFDDGQAALRLFEKTVRALAGTVLQPSEVTRVVDGRSDDQVEGPGTHNTQTLAWGTSTLFVSDDKLSYHLELRAKGKKAVPIPHGNTPVSIRQLRDRYEGMDFTCELDPKLESLKCQRRETGAVYTILAFDPCITATEEAEQLCANATAYSVSASVGFGQDLTDEQYNRFATFLVESTDFTVGGMSSQTREWLMTSLNDPNAKVHRADFQQLHLSVEPGAGVYEEFPNVFQVEVTGHNLTQ